MSAIKVDYADIYQRQKDLSAALDGLPSSANLNSGNSSGDGFNEFKQKVKDIENLVSQYAGLLAQDISAIKTSVKAMSDSDKNAASSIKRGKK